MLILTDGVFTDEIDDALVLLDTLQERVVVLQTEEKLILQGLLSEEIEKVVCKMKESYIGEDDTIEKDVRNFYEKLIASGFAKEAVK